jgi:VCBS repeat-containing protein
MKKIITAAAVAAVASMALAGTAGATSGTDSVVGQLRYFDVNDNSSETFTVNASQTATGASGDVTVTVQGVDDPITQLSEGTYHGTVTCVLAQGTSAQIEARLDEPVTRNGIVLDKIVLSANDNGSVVEPGGVSDADSIGGQLYSSATQVWPPCQRPLIITSHDDHVEGDVTVEDGMANPDVVPVPVPVSR